MENYQIKVICNKRLLLYNDTIQLYYKKGNIYHYRNDIFVAKKRIITDPVKYILSKLRVMERLLRLGPRFAVMADEMQILISNNGKLLNYNPQSHQLIELHRYRENVNNPLNIVKQKNPDGEMEFLYGEYWGNMKKEPVFIYQMKDGSWNKKYGFPGGAVRHIHALVADSYRKCMLVLTGDRDQESGIWMMRNDFHEVKPWVIGKQLYRSCVAFPVKEGLIYATDSPLMENAIYFLNESGDIVKLRELPGPCIYGTKIREKDGRVSYLFATSVEGDSSRTGWRYRLSYRLGKGVKDRYTHIIKGNREDGFEEICRLKKDMLPMLLFQFGNVQFPENHTDRILVTPVAVKKYDGKTIELVKRP